MTEIIKIKNIYDIDGKKWIDVRISFNAVSQLNKIILGDQVDDDNKPQLELRKQIHEDCLQLFKEFKK